MVCTKPNEITLPVGFPGTQNEIPNFLRILLTAVTFPIGCPHFCFKVLIPSYEREQNILKWNLAGQSCWKCPKTHRSSSRPFPPCCPSATWKDVLKPFAASRLLSSARLSGPLGPYGPYGPLSSVRETGVPLGLTVKNTRGLEVQMARYAPSGRTFATSGTPGFFAPEMLNRFEGHTNAVDWWQLGCLIVEHQVSARLGLLASIREALCRHSGKNLCLELLEIFVLEGWISTHELKVLLCSIF